MKESKNKGKGGILSGLSKITSLREEILKLAKLKKKNVNEIEALLQKKIKEQDAKYCSELEDEFRKIKESLLKK